MIGIQHKRMPALMNYSGIWLRLLRKDSIKAQYTQAFGGAWIEEGDIGAETKSELRELCEVLRI